jgi:nitrogen fixation protein NifU and related proteins
VNELRDLYQEVILDHYRRPRNFGAIESASHRADGNNPVCGDKLTLFLRIEDGRVAEVCFQGSGCAISTASASLMTEAIKGKSEAEARQMLERFQTGLTTPDAALAAGVLADLDKLAVFGGVREFPVRVKCATLPWHTLEAAFNRAKEPVKTE